MDKLEQIPNRLDEWLKFRPHEDFPANEDYASRFITIAAETMKISREIDRAALLAEILKKEGPIEDVIFLTHHGPDHIEKVIHRASDLVLLTGPFITSYEAYILLVGILIHDLGLLHGRANHATECRKILWELGDMVGNDTPEKQIISDIACAHSNGSSGDQDTIGKLEPVCYTLGKKIRPQLLAAILRFSDELSDDKSRASRFLSELRLITKGSEVFHAYSSALHSVAVAGRSINLTFYLTEKDALTPFKKGTTETYLLEEILDRSLKMHLERVYCMRFFPPEHRVEKIDVKIEVAGSQKNSFLHILDTISYRLNDGGYPILPADGIFSICPDLRGRAEECRRKLTDARRNVENGKV